MRLLTFMFMVILASGCATVTRGTTEAFAIESNPPGAMVRLSTGQTCQTPCSIKVKRRGDFVVGIEKDGYEEVTATVTSSIDSAGSAGMAGNVLIGGLIGAGVDAGTGAMHSHKPNPLSVNLVRIGFGSRKDPTVATFTGSCFFANSDGVALTNHHVIDGASAIFVITPDGTRHTARVVSQSASTDLAVLHTDSQPEAFLSLSAPKTAKTGMDVFTVGYPVPSGLGTEPKFTDGVISSLSGFQGEAAYLQISVPIQPGNSGGPLVNDSGEAVGIVTSSAAIATFYGVTGTLPQNVNWAVKSDYASLLLDTPTRQPSAATREEAIERAIRASCMVEAIGVSAN